jgi:hypothetical protein
LGSIPRSGLEEQCPGLALVFIPLITSHNIIPVDILLIMNYQEASSSKIFEEYPVPSSWGMEP